MLAVVYFYLKNTQDPLNAFIARGELTPPRVCSGEPRWRWHGDAPGGRGGGPAWPLPPVDYLNQPPLPPGGPLPAISHFWTGKEEQMYLHLRDMVQRCAHRLDSSCVCASAPTPRSGAECNG